jgi:hypothetical protein
MLLPNVLVKMLHVPPQVMRAVRPASTPACPRHPTQRRLAEPAIDKPGKPCGTPIDSAARGRGDRMMKRREFIAGLGGAAVTWPLAARAQQGDRVRRIGVLMTGDANDPQQARRPSAFTQALAGLGWTDGRNVRIDLRWYGDEINRVRALAQELVGLSPTSSW